MRTRTITMVEFDGMERQALERLVPSIRIAFPTDKLDHAKRHGTSAQAKAAQQQWEGRWLMQVCKTKQEWDARAIGGAWDALVTLIAVLEAQSDRGYWEREAESDTTETKVNLDAEYRAGNVLMAHGTDVCGVLAEARGAQLRDAREALPILEQAREVVGPVLEHDSIRYEGV